MAECAQLTPNRADSDTGGDDNEDTIMVQAPTLLSDAESTQWSLADQDMFSYLSTAVPDIWTVHDVSAFDPSMLDIPVSILPDDAASDLVLTPADTGQSPALRIGDAAGKGSQTSVITQHDAIESRSRRYVLDVPPELVVFLTDLYFQRVQAFLPLFHRPTFYQDYVDDEIGTKSENLSEDLAIILYAMMALSARYHPSPYYGDAPSKHRGVRFAERAQAIYDERSNANRQELKSLRWLQGCILLSFYNQACKPKGAATPKSSIVCDMRTSWGYTSWTNLNQTSCNWLRLMQSSGYDKKNDGARGGQSGSLTVLMQSRIVVRRVSTAKTCMSSSQYPTLLGLMAALWALRSSAPMSCSHGNAFVTVPTGTSMRGF